MQSRLFALLTLFFLPLMGAAQVTYRLGRLDAVGGGLGLGAALTGWVLSVQADGYTGPLPLDPGTVNRFDRFATRRWSPDWIAASDYASTMTIGSCVLALAAPKVRSEVVTLGVMAAETGLWLYGLNASTKALSLRPRPFLYDEQAPLDEQRKDDARFSFYSMHTSLSAGAAFFTAKVLHDMHPGARWRKWVWAGAAIAPLGVGMMRIAAGKHFPTDVLVGYGVGAGMGLLVPHLHKVRPAQAQWQLTPSPGGIGLVLNF